jgi:ABC-type multidrug transport system fused ATPase/permease subunit
MASQRLFGGVTGALAKVISFASLCFCCRSFIDVLWLFGLLVYDSYQLVLVLLVLLPVQHYSMV